MKLRSMRFALAAAAASAVVGAVAFAAPPVNVTASYAVANVDRRAAAVDLTFSAELFNQAARPVSGEVVLRDPVMADRVFARFGRVTIPAGGTVRVSASDVQVPDTLFRSWSAEGAPGLYINVQNDQGDVTLFRMAITHAALD